MSLSQTSQFLSSWGWSLDNIKYKENDWNGIKYVSNSAPLIPVVLFCRHVWIIVAISGRKQYLYFYLFIFLKSCQSPRETKGAQCNEWMWELFLLHLHCFALLCSFQHFVISLLSRAPPPPMLLFTAPPSCVYIQAKCCFSGMSLTLSPVSPVSPVLLFFPSASLSPHVLSLTFLLVFVVWFAFTEFLLPRLLTQPHRFFLHTRVHTHTCTHITQSPEKVLSRALLHVSSLYLQLVSVNLCVFVCRCELVFTSDHVREK